MNNISNSRLDKLLHEIDDKCDGDPIYYQCNHNISIMDALDIVEHENLLRDIDTIEQMIIANDNAKKLLNMLHKRCMDCAALNNYVASITDENNALREQIESLSRKLQLCDQNNNDG